MILADGFSCRTQLEQLARVRGTHLAQLLASRLEPAPAGGRAADQSPAPEARPAT